MRHWRPYQPLWTSKHPADPLRLARALAELERQRQGADERVWNEDEMLREAGLQ